MRLNGGAVLRREAVRTARRWQTYVMRFAISGLMLSLVLSYLLVVHIEVTDVATLGDIGRGLFKTLTTGLFSVTLVLAPLMVASGIEEEQEAKTLDLLSLTGMSASQLLWDKVLSRLMVLLTFIVGSLPFLAAATSFGGFSVGETVNAIVGTLLAALVLGVFASFVAMMSRGGPLLALMLCVPYSFVLMVFPVLYFAIMAGEGNVEVALALALLTVGDPWVLLSVLPWLAAMFSGWPLAVSVFRIATSDDGGQGFGLLSTEFWVIERFKRRTWLMGLAWGISVVPLFTIQVLSSFRMPQHWWYVGLVWLSAALLLITLHRLSLMGVLAVSNHVEAWRQKRTGSDKRLAQSRPVRGNPVIWRETATSSAGMARYLPYLFGGLWLLGALPLSYEEGFFDAEANTLLAVVAYLFAWFGTTLISTSVAVEERRRRTVPLVLLTPMGARGLASGKHWSSVRSALPLLVMGTCVFLLSDPADFYFREHARHSHLWGPNLPMPFIVVMPFWLPWGLLCAGNLGLASRIAVHWVPRRMVWIGGLAGAFLWFVGPVAFIALLDENIFINNNLDYIIALWIPFIDVHALFCDLKGLPLTLVGAILTQGVVAVGLRRALAWRFRRQAAQKG